MKMQRQLQWRGMGSKLEKGLEGKKKKDLEHGSQSLGTKTKSVSHRPIFLVFFFLFLFFFFFLLVCTGPKPPYRVGAMSEKQRKKKKKRHRSDTGVWRVLPVSVSDTCRTPVLCQKWLVGATQTNTREQERYLYTSQYRLRRKYNFFGLFFCLLPN